NQRKPHCGKGDQQQNSRRYRALFGGWQITDGGGPLVVIDRTSALLCCEKADLRNSACQP
ncbi:MAG: hypothetical protein KDA99_20745, partial [Planctomycetales bacterium]|nr:hypothetical protein [Planctomycetales bacterium]